MDNYKVGRFFETRCRSENSLNSVSASPVHNVLYCGGDAFSWRNQKQPAGLPAVERASTTSLGMLTSDNIPSSTTAANDSISPFLRHSFRIVASIIKHHFLNLDNVCEEKRSWWAVTTTTCYVCSSCQ